mgnify:CR=1 FL=1
MNLDSAEFIRVGTSYYAIIERPTISKDTEKIMISWNKETIVNDLGKDYISAIKKYYGFCCIPQHINYEREVGDFYNIYHPLDYNIEIESEIDLNELQLKIPFTLKYIKHIFGEQYLLGLDYLKILLENPTQILPVLVLVSSERETGKSTFLKWLRKIFSFNATFINADSFVNNFNSDLNGKLLVLVDEIITDNQQVTERIKFLSTADRNKIESKGKDKEEVESFYKFVMTSNFEKNFIKIDKKETRFWVRKIPSIIKNPDFDKHLYKEIPFFLNYLIRIIHSTPKQTRMWFTPEQIRTSALTRLMDHENEETKSKVYDVLFEIHENFNTDEILIAPMDIQSISKKIHGRNPINPKEARKILKSFGLTPTDNTLTYEGFELLPHGEFVKIKRLGRYFKINFNEIRHFFDENDESLINN